MNEEPFIITWRAPEGVKIVIESPRHLDQNDMRALFQRMVNSLDMEDYLIVDRTSYE